MRIREHLTLLSSFTLLVLIQPVYSQVQDKNLNDYDSDFFSIKYPSSWFVNFERGVSNAPGSSGVTLLNRIDMNQNNRLSSDSIIAVTVLPKTVFPIIVSNFNDSEIVNSFANFSFSPQKLSELGSELLTDNSTSLSRHYARSVSYTSNSELGHTYNLMLISADRDNLYQIVYSAPVSKFRQELTEVKSIISSFEIKKPKISTIESTTDINGVKFPFAVYNSSKYGIKLLYPKNWDVQEEVSEIVSFTTPSNLTQFPEAMFSISGTTFLQGRPHFERFSVEQFKDFVNETIGVPK